ncbi:CIA30 family protein [Flavobacterium degerlachei]|uniref:Complex I intermediate-associated protein 30 (CIA30) n=1 Tax=Flavobacterium degerlachei TaxID=229203 RepID=A0A1H2UG04_9FLAO|nr:CIA30 family protein [Flavobacterium degerlachei]SDW54454.1 Complex I intermediate-associated protein 30 (CIA30) [Flavobacterium degerlachei]
MNYLMGIIILTVFMNRQIIFDFNKNANIQGWKIVDDAVMGGESSGTFKLSPDGHGVFEGSVSLENNGGFSMVRYPFDKIKVNKDNKIILKLRGDGKKYQLRIKDNSSNYYWYISAFATSGAWQEIEIPLKDMYPSFRGKKMDLPDFSQNHIEEIAFLIGNKKSEKFKLIIDKIELK